ncbi:hypothetical protein ACJROX_09885 [Pseudalkalibacillus sp. A8]|uniref:hypothetical protein n=1 Tax=Pseudalkalibacillus sp. A8 TaxID=3382641 RepID=UPI0038B56201
MTLSRVQIGVGSLVICILMTYLLSRETTPLFTDFILVDSLDGTVLREKYLLLDGLGIFIIVSSFHQK